MSHRLKIKRCYFNSTLAPAASNFFFASSASFLGTLFFTSLGAPSTKSFASLSPNPVIALTSLITLIFLSPADDKKIVNSLFLQQALLQQQVLQLQVLPQLTPHFSSNCFDNSAASTTVNLESSSMILFRSAI